MDQLKKLKPSKLFYLIGALVIAAGVVCSIAIAVNSVMGTLGNAKKVQVPGTSQVNLDKTGTYTMMYGYYPSTSSRVSAADYSKYAGLTFTLTQKQSGDDVVVTTATSGIFDFKITQAGTYSLSGAYPSGKSASSVVMLLIDPTSVPSSLIAIIFMVGVCGGLAIIIVTSIKRKKNKKLQGSNNF